MDVFLETETLIIELLLVVSLVAIAVRRLRVPYTVALVLVGLVLTFGGSLPIELTPDLILALFVPPLIFEAAFHLEFSELRRNLRPILLLAGAGVLLTTALVGTFVAFGTGMTLASGLVFGALHREGMISASTWARLDEELGGRARAHLEAQQALLREQPGLRASELDDARREALRAERTTLTELHGGGVISEQIYGELVGEVDAALADEGHAESDDGHRQTPPAAGPLEQPTASEKHEAGP